MKFFCKTWLLLVTACAACTLQAAPVDSLTVSKVATTYLNQYVTHFNGLDCVIKQTAADGTALYYVFNHKNNSGFIIVTADDACFPILGYAATGSFSPANVPPQLTKLLFQRAAEISFIKREKLKANEEITQFWQRLKSPSAAARTGQVQAVGPLLTTTWNQAPYYNDLCPKDDASGQRAVTGCVATAMAQIMKYHNYPRTGQGYHTYISNDFGQLTANFGATTYNWSSMPNSLTRQSSASNVSAVATLMYHCGVSVEMGYTIESSGALPSKIANAFISYFGYASSTQLVERKKYATESAWIAMLKKELDAKRPIEYHGFGGESGHSFVCDGYTNDNLFHFNWGWGSQSDGFFYTNKLDPDNLGIGSGDGVYNDNQGAIIGIQPATAVSNSFDLQMNKKLTVNPSPMTFGDDVAVSINITNKGTAAFQGDYCAALFSGEGDFISFIGDIKTNFGLAAGNRYINDLVFTQKSLFISEGNYQIGAYYREPQGEWKSLGNATFDSFIQVPAKGVSSDLKMVRVPLQTNATPIIQKAPLTVSCNIGNFGTTTFEGELSMDLQGLDGKVIARLEVKKDIVIPANSTFSSSLVFRTAGLDVPVGTYFISPGYKRKNETSYYYPAAYKDNNGTYPNLIRVVVAAPPLVADRFESNDKDTQPATLPLSFVNNVATATSEGSNLHVVSDLDHYKLDLPAGYSYQLTARVHDSDNPGNGKTYTADVIFSYKMGNGAYSRVNDVSVNDINDKIDVADGGTVTFKLAPIFAGEKGTYLLDIQVTRKQIVLGVEDDGFDRQLTVYPNPTAGPLTVQAPSPVKFQSVNVLNGMGQNVLELTPRHTTDKLFLDLSNYPAGMYYLQIKGDTQSTTRKISLIK